jgi:hypothetical protein
VTQLNTDHITVHCACGKRLKAPSSAVGKRAKCPKCGAVVRIEAPPPPPAEEGELGLDALYDLAEKEAQVAAQQEAASPTMRCPSCGSGCEPGAVLCVNCGYDFRTKGKIAIKADAPEAPAKPGWFSRGAKKDKPVDKMAPQGSFFVGLGLSIAAALVASVVWFVVVYFTHFELVYLALLVGAAAGGGMQVGQKGFSTLGGVAAAGVTLGAILLAKFAIIVAIIWPTISSEADESDGPPDNTNPALVSALAEQDLRQRKIDPDEATDEQMSQARKAARERAKTMSPADQQKALRQQEEQEITDQLEAYVVLDVLKERNIDPDDADEAQEAMAEKEAAKRVAAIPAAKRADELKRREAQAEAEMKKALEEAQDKRDASGEDADDDEGGGTVARAGFLLFMLLLIFGWKSALFMILGMGLAYTTAAGSVTD